MGLNSEVEGYLLRSGVPFETLQHARVYSSIEEARTLGIEADEILKTLVIMIRGEKALAIVPGGRKVDTHKLRDVFGSKHARLASEDEMRQEFPEFELGAVPPLPEVVGLRGYVDRQVLGHETVVFTGGTHTDSVRMNSADFVNMIQPEIVDLCRGEEEEMAA